MKKTFNMGLFTFFKNLFSSSEVAPPSRYTHTICNPDCNFDIELLSDEIIIKDETDYDTISVSGGDLLEVAISSPIRLKIKSKRVSTIDNTYRKVRASVLKSDLTDLQIDAIFNGNYSLFPTSSIMYYENETKNLFRLAEVPFSDSEFKVEEKGESFIFVINLAFDISNDSTVETKDNKLGASKENIFEFALNF